MPWPFAKIEQPRPPSKLATTLGLQATTPDNAIRMAAGALRANNRAHTIKADYDTNNPPPPPAARKQK